MEPTEEQKKIAALNLITELFQFGINRGAYSSVEVNAFNHAANTIRTVAEPKVEVPTEEASA